MQKVRNVSRWLALMAFFVLAGCAASAVPSGSVPVDDTTISRNIATAERFVQTAEMAANACIALRLPVCSSPAFVAGVRKAEAVADEAIAEAKAYPVNGSTADKINAALRVAMNAVLLFYSLK